MFWVWGLGFRVGIAYRALQGFTKIGLRISVRQFPFLSLSVCTITCLKPLSTDYDGPCSYANWLRFRRVRTSVFCSLVRGVRLGAEDGFPISESSSGFKGGQGLG